MPESPETKQARRDDQAAVAELRTHTHDCGQCSEGLRLRPQRRCPAGWELAAAANETADLLAANISADNAPNPAQPALFMMPEIDQIPGQRG